jgi:hypothetical protein
MSFEPAIEPGRTAQDLHTPELIRHDNVTVGLSPAEQRAVADELAMRQHQERVAAAVAAEEERLLDDL